MLLEFNFVIYKTLVYLIYRNPVRASDDDIPDRSKPFFYGRVWQLGYCGGHLYSDINISTRFVSRLHYWSH